MVGNDNGKLRTNNMNRTIHRKLDEIKLLLEKILEKL